MSKKSKQPQGNHPPSARPHLPGGDIFSAQMQQALQHAIYAYQSGNWPESERLCRLLLASSPGQFDALHLLGIITAQTRRSDEAADLLLRAAAVNPNNAEVQNSRGNVLRDLGRSDEALQCYERALQLNRKYVEAHNNRGTVLQRLHRFEEALESYDRALKLRPDYAEAHSNRATALHELKRHDAALQAYERALRLDPRYAPAYYNRGNLLRELGRNQDALQSYDQALEIRPADAEALNNRGNALRDLRRYAEAVESYQRALAINPGFPDAHNNLGTALQSLQRYEEALQSFERALQLKPGYAEALNNCGIALQSLHRHDAAIQRFDAALQANPDYAQAWANRGLVLLQLKRYPEALSCYESALKIWPEGDFLPGQWLFLKGMNCDWANLNAQIENVNAGIVAGRKMISPFNCFAVCDTPAVQKRAAEIWAREKAPPQPVPPERKKHAPHAKIRIGYFSADFREHPVASLTAALFETHDRARFEIYAFSFGPDTGDAMRRRLEKSFDRFIDVQKLDDAAVAAMAAELEIDFAVDLGGFTQDCRTGIFAMRAAPVQVNFLGYAGTMGVEYMDYLFADATIIPEASRQFYTEKIAYLPSYQPNDASRRISSRVFARAEFGLPAHGFVFCSFNNQYKILPDIFAVWMRLLSRVEGSVLWLSDAGDLAKNNLRGEASRLGIDPARVIFAPRMPLVEDHLARQRLADLFVDTLPYNAHTTASDALWAGLPVLTCAGETFAARVAASALTAMGLPELITASIDEYESLAVALAADPQRLAQLRQTIEARRSSSLLFDIERYTRAMEDAYIRMLARSQAGLPPEHLPVAQ